jgi:Site-specific recombinases, DNA invertase Pin homologs
MPTAAAVYARISSDPEGDGLGVSRQVQDCERLAERRGWPIGEVYVDDDRSAYSGKVRPEYRRMLDDIRAGAVDAVVVWHLDRLHRQPRELEEFFEVCDAARLTALASVTGDTDLSSHDGRFLARILGAVARKESDDKSRRITRKHVELAQAGKPTGGGSRPFGYRADRRTVEPTEAAAVREASRRIRAGDSLRALATDWNARKIATVSGKPWSVQVLCRMLLGARLSGQRSYHDEIVAQGDWEAILTPAETTQLRAILTNPVRLTRRTVRRYLLSGGLLRCALCDAVLVARPRSDGTRRYICPKGPGLAGCGRIAVLSEPVEELVTEAVLYRLDTPELAASLDGIAADNAEAMAERDSLAADLAQLEQLATAYGERVVTFPEYLAARKPIATRIEVAKRRMSRLTQTTAIDGYVGQSGALREAWPTLPLTRQRAIVAAVLDRAVVRSAVRGGKRFDPDRIDPVWRV